MSACGDAAHQDCGPPRVEGALAVAVAVLPAVATAVDGSGPVSAARPAAGPFRLYPEWAQRGPFW